MARLREGAPGPLHVGWYPNPEEGLWTPAQAQCFNNLLRPMLQLIGAVENQVALETGRNMGEGENVCSYDAIVQAYHRGEPIPKLSAPDELRQSVREEIAAFGQKPVTITLREIASSVSQFQSAGMDQGEAWTPKSLMTAAMICGARSARLCRRRLRLVRGGPST
jgi:hypothetical protein